MPSPSAPTSFTPLPPTARTLGEVSFSSSDGSATLPAAYTFLPVDAGQHTFAGGAALTVPGTQTVEQWATDISAGPANESGQTLTFNPCLSPPSPT